MKAKSRSTRSAVGVFSDIQIERKEGERPLAFRGYLLAEATSRDDESVKRWTEHRIYKTADSEYVVATVGRSIYPNESDRHSAVVCIDVEAVVTALMRRGALTIVGQQVLERAALTDPAFENSWIEKLSGTTTSTAEKRKRLQMTAAQLEQSFPRIAADREFFDLYSKIVRERGLFPGNELLMNTRRWHIESLIMALRRQVDRDPRTYSLRALLTELISHPESYTKEALHQLFASADDVDYDTEMTLFLVDSTYKEFADESGERLDVVKLENDRQFLDQAAELAKHIADRSIAHADMRGVDKEQESTYNDIYEIVDRVGEVARKYVRLLTGRSYVRWAPVDLTDWQDILLEPWRFKVPFCTECWQPISGSGVVGLRSLTDAVDEHTWVVAHAACISGQPLLLQYDLSDVQRAPLKFTYLATSAPIVARRPDRDAVAKSWYRTMQKCVPYAIAPEFAEL